MSVALDEPPFPTGIAEFFSGKTVFLTGSTGLLGQLILEKLLRTCLGIKMIYVMLREKKNQTVEERFEKLFDNVIFDQVRAVNPNGMKKVIPISGDNEIVNLKLGPEDFKRLIDEVNIIIHCSADVRFNATIRKMAYSNVRCTRDMLMLAKKMTYLEAFVYVSTAYSNCPNKEIREVIYKPPLSADKLLNLVEAFDDDLLEKLTPSLLGDWPNTYVYCKSVSEALLAQEGKGLPVAIIRPSMIVSTINEPLSGWTNNLYGPIGVSVGIYVGLAHVFRGEMEFVVDIVPADYVCNLIIAAAWKLKAFKQPSAAEIKVYNCVSSPQNPIRWKEAIGYVLKYTKKTPTMTMRWYPFFLFISSPTLYSVINFLLHEVPAHMIDFYITCMDKKPIKAVKTYKKFKKLAEALIFFSTRQWTFFNENTLELWDSLSVEDKQKYPFNMDSFNWDDYYYHAIRRGRIEILNDPLETIPKAKKKYFRLKALNYGLATIVMLQVCFLLYLVYITFEALPGDTMLKQPMLMFRSE